MSTIALPPSRSVSPGTFLKVRPLPSTAPMLLARFTPWSQTESIILCYPPTRPVSSILPGFLPLTHPAQPVSQSWQLHPSHNSPVWFLTSLLTARPRLLPPPPHLYLCHRLHPSDALILHTIGVTFLENLSRTPCFKNILCSAIRAQWLSVDL